MFKVPCDRANNGTTPQFFRKAELQVMESEVYHHMAQLSGQLYVLSKFMCEVDKDRVKDSEKKL